MKITGNVPFSMRPLSINNHLHRQPIVRTKERQRTTNENSGLIYLVELAGNHSFY